MKTSSQGVANALLDLAEGHISHLKLMKMIYLVHGFSLAVKSKRAINTHYDEVEAWELGPVIPSIYHELKRFGTTKFIGKYRLKVIGEDEKVKKAVLSDTDIIKACEFVWCSFKNLTSKELVELTHKHGSPWEKAWAMGRNTRIEDAETKVYFTRWAVMIDEDIKKRKNNG